MTEHKVFISIINWNSTGRTLKCVQMLQAQDHAHKQIVVVDNASQPDSLAALRKQLPADVWLISSDTNTGYAGGHAQALAVARQNRADFFWVLNSDIVLQSAALRLFLEAYQRYGDAIYGTVPLEAQANKPLSDYAILFHRKYFLRQYREILLYPFVSLRFGEAFPTMEPRPVPAVAGSCVFLPLSLVEQHGFMDEAYFMYCEEVDYCFRLAGEGIQSIVVPEAYILHEHEGTSRQYKRLHSIVNYYRLRNQLVRIQRYGNGFDLVRAVIKDLLLIAWYLIGQGQAGREKARTGIQAIVDGLQGKLGKILPPENYLNE